MDTAVKSRLARRLVPLLVLVVLTLGAAPEVTGQAPPAGEAVMAWPITIAPTWFDPSTAPPQITPFGILYALHDALVRPLPGQKMGNSMAESWRESPDGLIYEFKLRRGLKFHNGDDVTGDDVKFSFERYKGAGAKELGLRVRQVDVVDPLTVRFVLKEPWPDFMTFYGTTATAAGIVCRRSTSPASATRHSESTRSAQAHTSSSAITPAWRSSWRRTPDTGGACPASSGWS